MLLVLGSYSTAFSVYTSLLDYRQNELGIQYSPILFEVQILKLFYSAPFFFHFTAFCFHFTLFGFYFSDLNDLDQRPIQQHVKIRGDVSSGKPLSVNYEDNLADHPLGQ